MQLHKKYVFALCLACGAWSATAQTNQRALEDFMLRGADFEPIHLTDSLRQLQASDDCLEALQFLYAYMPWPDVANYSVEFHRQQAECALRARRELPWGPQVPQREWLHFVLPARVNNEALDGFRPQYYKELKERVAGLSMREAVLEINHWCHEHVTYKPSDARTSSPLATLQTATGRCGEESTLTVAALRTVGIPARQVYTPRWAHTDDNHAWVEAWVDGEWHFLGACEPEPVLDLGWFNQPASRGMLMHTKVFGRYRGEEEIISQNDCFTEINVTPNYAATALTQVRVVDAAGKPCPGARVEFKIYNYAEFFTVKTAQTNRQGTASIRTGLGDFIAWATDGTHYGFAKIRAGAAGAEVRLTHGSGENFSEHFTVTPPQGSARLPQVSAETAARHARRLAHEDSLRAAYVASFADSAQTLRWCERTGLPFGEVRPYVVRSCGNWRNLQALLEEFPQRETLRWLGTLSEKDLRDFSLPTLRSHLQALHLETAGSLDEEQKDFVYKYIFSPRMHYEALTPWRTDFGQLPAEVADALRNGGAAGLAAWIAANVADNAERNPQGLSLSPARALATRRADALGRALLFVALCRTQGIAARINEVTGAVEYAETKEDEEVPTERSATWLRASLSAGTADAQAAKPAMASLSLTYEPRKFLENPNYYQHFTLSRLAKGRPVLQNYPEDATLATTFRKRCEVEAGDYLLTSGTRLADGSALVQVRVFAAAAGQKCAVPLVLPQEAGTVEVIGSFNSENRYLNAGKAREESILATTGRGYFALGLLKANHEPSNHLLQDLAQQRTALEAWGRPIVLLFESRADLAAFEKRRQEFAGLPRTVVFGIDASGSVRRDLTESGLAAPGDLPVLIVADTFNRVVSATQGYAVGLGTRLASLLGRLK
ncbi:MAG: transglutaminase domain-containing protein [Alloprevotella sp.]|nr:transglutaminase domain-containing protein [Alloprevotella sp.]